MRCVRIVCHAAVSLDGRIAQGRVTTSLSTPEGRRSAHSARARADAVLVGSDTVRIDDPRLTVRECEGRDPLRVVLASTVDLPARARIFDKPGRALVIGVNRLTEVDADIELVEADSNGMVGLSGALEVLRRRGVKRLLVEGGSRVLGSFFREGLIDHVELEIAMTVLGSGIPLVDGLGSPVRLGNVRTSRLGTSMLV